MEIDYIKLKDAEIDPAAIKKVPAKLACHYNLMPLRIEKDTLIVAMKDSGDVCTLDDIELYLGCKVRPVRAGENDILEGIKRYYGLGAETIERIMEEGKREERVDFEKTKVEDIKDMAADASIIKFVNQIFLEAWQNRATDIHIEPYEDELVVRSRVDGVLYDIAVPRRISHLHPAIVSRIKVMASLNITEQRLPQDGRIKIRVGKDELDLRVSILPTPYGESVTIRILSTDKFFTLSDLGLSVAGVNTLESMLKLPHGIIFVTGPTGSGKTTTLYTCLNMLNDKQKKILTIEDPIEYKLNRITQIQVQPNINLTFAAGLRSMLRHDPDIMMVGEVRDLETADISIRLALTGHLVFSTLHTNDAAAGATRLLDIGIEPYLTASSVICFIAQRLVRVLCPHCKKEVKPTKELLEETEKTANSSPMKVYESRGCESCRWTGYQGRTGIYEMLAVNDEIRELFLKRASASEIKKKAVFQGMKTLRQDGWEKVLAGITAVSEVLRVTRAEEIR